MNTIASGTYLSHNSSRESRHIGYQRSNTTVVVDTKGVQRAGHRHSNVAYIVLNIAGGSSEEMIHNENSL